MHPAPPPAGWSPPLRQRYRIFLSSTFEDLKPYRESVIRAVRTAGYDIDPMEEWTADPREPKVFSTERILEADICVLIVARRRGYIPQGDSRSITQQEYFFAVEERRIPVLPFLLEDGIEWPSHWDDREIDSAMKEWRNHLRAKHGTPFFPANPERLTIGVLEALSRWRLEFASKQRIDHRRTPLPVPLTRFFGRDQEIQDLEHHLFQERTRVLTVLAQGGYGKTRLVIETVNRNLSEVAGPIVFVDLTEAESVLEIATFTAKAIGLSLERANESDPLKLIEQALAEREGLLILDNFEQVTPFAQETVGRWSENLPGIQIVVTSRIALHISGEQVYHLKPLPLPTTFPEQGMVNIIESPAIQLFADRVKKHHPQFVWTPAAWAMVVEICRRVECQPLLIEIAASRTKTRKLAQLADDLQRDDWLKILESSERPFRKKEGGAALKTLAWSYELLSPVGKAIFTQVCIFRGGFDESAVQRVVAFPSDVVLATVLEELLDHCFLKFDIELGRYFPYAQSLQEFGRQLWPGSDHAPPKELGERWAGYYLSIARERNDRLRSAEASSALRELEMDRENILEAQLWAVRENRCEEAADLMTASIPFLSIRGPFVMARDRIQTTLQLLGDTDPLRSSHLHGELAMIFRGLGDFPSAQQSAAESRNRLAGIEKPFLRAYCDYWQGCVVRGNSEAERLLNKAMLAFLDEYQTGNHEAGRMASLAQGFMGYTLDQQGMYEAALHHHLEAEARLQKVGDHSSLGLIRNSVGLVYWHFGKPREAVACFEQAEAMHEEMGDRLWMAGAITNHGLSLTDLDQFSQAIAQFDRALGMLNEVGNRAWVAVNRGGRGRALARAGEVDAGLELMSWAEMTALERGNPADAAMHAGFRGRVLCKVGCYAEALEALEQSIRLAHQSNCVGTLRHMGNLAHYAFAAIQLNHREQAISSAHEAENLALQHGVDVDHPIASIAEGLRLLQEVNGILASSSANG